MMTIGNSYDDDQLTLVEKMLIDDFLETPDEEILREVRAKGNDPDQIAIQFKKIAETALVEAGKWRMAQAMSEVNGATSNTENNVLKFSVEKKAALVASFAANNGDFAERATIAARGAKIEGKDEDLDSILEAMIMLGVIDEDGNEV